MRATNVYNDKNGASYQKGEDRNLVVDDDVERMSARSRFRHDRKQSMKHTRMVALGAVLFTVAVMAAITTVSNREADDSEKNLVHREVKSGKYNWYEQMKEAEEEKKRLEKCNDGSYSKNTLKLAYELPFSSLFKDNRNQKKFEASDLVLVGDYAYAVCDNSWAISKFGSSLTPFSSENILIGDPYREEDESGYEAILHEAGVFYIVRESILKETGKPGSLEGSYHAVVEEITVNESDLLDYDVGNACMCEFEFEGDSKGFEGAISLLDTNNTMVILGLCEGNFCLESTKDKPGNGRLVAMKKEQREDGCEWKTVKEITVPKSAYFQDYSAITINGEGQVAISSQEDSAVWIGQLNGRQESGLWDLDELEFEEKGDYNLFQFPKSSECHTVYCNVEGIHWLDNNMLMAVSDKMKSKGKQDFRCFDKDQSVHAFVLP